jgi:hypothetical protein
VLSSLELLKQESSVAASRRFPGFSLQPGVTGAYLVLYPAPQASASGISVSETYAA